MSLLPESHPAKPLLLISSCQRAISDKHYAATNGNYIRAAARQLSAAPLLLGNDADYWSAQDSRTLLQQVDGLLLTGSSSNIHPQHSVPDTGNALKETQRYEPFDLDRDGVTLPLIRTAIELGVPLLAICRGHQELNVALGGTLKILPEPTDQDVRHFPVATASAEEQYAKAHEITAVPGSVLTTLWQQETIRVNSYHYQAIDQLAEGLRIEATAPDGVIEAVSCPSAKAFTLGVQWHPEADINGDDDDQHSLALFAAFGKAIRQYQQQRQHPHQSAREV